MKQPTAYYNRVNEWLLSLIPESAYRILDVGCASGALGYTLKQRQECLVTGVELVPDQAEVAGGRLDEVYVGDIIDVALALPRAQYDCIVLGDVLEHMTDPEVVLKRLRPLLAARGQLVMSIPNVRHWSVVKALLEGHWDYEDAGLLDQTHIRFFTRDSLETLLRHCGYEPILKNAVTLAEIDAPSTECIAHLAGDGIDISTLKNECRVYQYLYSAVPTEGGAPRNAVDQYSVSIVILAHNLWEQTEKCLDSIRCHTPQPYEVIVVDNGSTDETSSRLRELGLEWPVLRTITNKENLGFAEGCNQGIKLGWGQFVILLNNDTMVTEGWLGHMMSVMDRYPETGIVGPMSNYVAGVQKVSDAEYDDLGDGLKEYAAQWTLAHCGQSMLTQAVVGFCMLIRREVFDTVGLLDEQFKNGFEEYDICLRATAAGYDTRVARGVFIHHTGSQTFKEVDTDYWGNIQSNYELFRAKWPKAIPSRVRAKEGSAWLFCPEQPPQVYWSVFFERAMLWEVVDTILDVSAAAGILGYKRIAVPFTRIDNARNQVERMFLRISRNPNDTLIMLDYDHFYAPDVLERLASHESTVGVVGALAFRRGPPYEPMFFVRNEEGVIHSPAEWDDTLYECDAVGTGAIAIKRWVFDKLETNGLKWPHFRFEYSEETINQRGEDFGFAELCQKAEIQIYCDTTFEIPHLSTTAITSDTWEKYMQKHPEIVREVSNAKYDAKHKEVTPCQHQEQSVVE